MNAIETTLTLILVSQAAARTHVLRDSAGYPTPTDEQRNDMTSRQVQAVQALLAGLRDNPAGPVPTLSELAEFCEGLAQGALLAVMGVPPDVAAEQAMN
jgi:hypothetical protein